MSYQVDSAVIMAAGTASRFAPLSYERPKALIEVKGEVLIERQIRQLQEAGIPEIIVVVGYMAEQFAYLADKFGVKIIENKDFLTRNNNSSIYVAKEHIRNTYICSSDNYFSKNPFEKQVDSSYYAAIYADGPTQEWCMTEDAQGYIDSVTVGGENAWFMLGHVFWDQNFSSRFLDILEKIYNLPETANVLWEKIFMDHLNELKMKIRRYDNDVIFEFDTLDELREFDTSYVTDTRSAILKSVAQQLCCREQDIVRVTSYKDKDNAAAGMRFYVNGQQYQYAYCDKTLTPI
jgi:CTP:phosphocholine cytidylyltransferase-like protein